MEIYDVNQYVNTRLPRPYFYIENILPKQGSMLLYGEPKAMKSWLALYMAFCIATGTPCLGMRTEQARTILCNFEIASVSYRNRIQQMQQRAGFTLQDNMLFETSPMLTYLDDTEVFNRFMASLDRVQPQVIVLDCLSACFGKDENNGGDMAQFISRVSTLIARYNASVILVHHTNKNVLMGATDRARGHSRLAGYVDTLAYLAIQPAGLKQLQIKARQAITDDIPNINLRFQNYIWNIV